MTARIVIDQQEKLPLDFGSVPTVVAHLKTGDYSLEGVTDLVAVERKSKADMYGCVGADRDRFERCVQRLSQMDRAAVVIECSLRRFKTPPERTKITAAQAIHSCISWQVRYGVPFVWVDTREDAAAWIYQFLCRWVKYRYSAVSQQSPPAAPSAG